MSQSDVASQSSAFSDDEQDDTMFDSNVRNHPFCPNPCNCPLLLTAEVVLRICLPSFIRRKTHLTMTWKMMTWTRLAIYQ